MSATPVDFELRTSRYANKAIAGSGLVPVGITAGHPRFRLAYCLAANLKSLAPSRAWFDLAHDRFEELYIGKLEQQGASAIAAELTASFNAHRTPRDTGLVLLCFENLAVPGAECHRRTFSDYWLRETGQHVDELGDAVIGLSARPENAGANDE